MKPINKFANQFALAATAVAVAATLAACGKKEEPKVVVVAPAAAPEMVVKIGHVGPISGAIAHLGKDN